MSDNINSRTGRREKDKANRNNKKGSKPTGTINIIKKIFLVLVLIGFAGLLGGAGLFAYYASSAPALDEDLLKDPLSSEILDVHGNVFMKSGVEKREFVP